MRSCVYHLNPLNLPEWRSLCWWCGGPSKVRHGTSMSCDVHHQMPPSCEVSGFEHVRFFSTATCNTLWLQDTSGLWDTIGHRSLAFTSWLFFSIPKYFKSPSASPKKMFNPLLDADTPFKQPTHVPTENVHQKSDAIGESSPPPAWFRPLSWWIAVPKDLPDQRCHP